MKFLGELIDQEDLVVIGRWAILIGLGMLLIFAVALGAGIAVNLFDLARGA